MLENGLTIEEVIRFCKSAKEHGVDVLDVSEEISLRQHPCMRCRQSMCQMDLTLKMRVRIRKETGMLTVGVGRINTAELAEEILSQDKVDMVVLGRAQLADPGICKQSQSGKSG